MPITLPARRWRGWHRRQDHLDDPAVLLFDDAADDPLPVHGEGREQDERAEDCDQRRGISRSGVGWPERRRAQLGRRRQVAPQGSHRSICDSSELRVDIRAEDEPVLAQEQERIDVLGHERLASGCRRTDHAELRLRVERLGGALERGVEPGWHRCRHRNAVRRLARERPVQRGRRADEQEQDEGRGEERGAAQPLADLAPGDECHRTGSAHRPTSSRKRSDSEGGP